MSAPAGRRRFAVTLVVLAAASIGVVVAYGATWAVATVPVFAGEAAAAQPGREIALAGRDLAPLGGAMGWVGFAGVAALLATRTWGRRATGAVVGLAGGIAGVVGLTFGLTDAASGGGGAFVSAALGARTDAVADSVSITAWWAVATAAGLAMLACGIAAVVDGPSWPRLGARYSRGADSPAASAAATWDALDRGEDPTTVDEPGEDPAAPPGSMG